MKPSQIAYCIWPSLLHKQQTQGSPHLGQTILYRAITVHPPNTLANTSYSSCTKHTSLPISRCHPILWILCSRVPTLRPSLRILCPSLRNLSSFQRSFWTTSRAGCPRWTSTHFAAPPGRLSPSPSNTGPMLFSRRGSSVSRNTFPTLPHNGS